LLGLALFLRKMRMWKKHHKGEFWRKKKNQRKRFKEKRVPELFVRRAKPWDKSV
jgi:hypothetical protein